MEPNIQRNADGHRRIVVRTQYVRNRCYGSAQAAQWSCLCRSRIAVRSPMVTLSPCPGRREVVVWVSYWRRGRSENAIGLTKVAHQSAMRAQHDPYCSHTEECFSDIWRPHGDLVDSLGRHGRSVVTVLCDRALWSLTSVIIKQEHICIKSSSQFVKGPNWPPPPIFLNSVILEIQLTENNFWWILVSIIICIKTFQYSRVYWCKHLLFCIENNFMAQ